MANRVLFVAVSGDMAQMARKTIVALHEQIPVVTANKNTAINAISAYPDCSIYISRGKTADALRSLPGKTVVEVATSADEIFQAVGALVAKGINRIGVVAARGMISCGENDYKLGSVQIYMRPFDGGEAPQILNDLKKRGVRGIVTGSSSADLVRQHGMEPEILNCGESSIRAVVERATDLARAEEFKQQENEEYMRQVHEYSSELYAAIDRSFEAVKALEVSAREQAGTSQQAADIAQRAYEQVERTNEVLSLVENIASQTTILGINGAIESARAGAAGKGFSVIANEIRRLATESDKSVDRIGSDLETLKSHMQAVLQNVQKGNEISQNQAQENEALSRMLDNLRSTGQRMAEFMDQRTHV